MWLPAARIEPRVVLHHKGCRDGLELLRLSGAGFVSLPLSLPRCDEPRVQGQGRVTHCGCTPFAAGSTSQPARAVAGRPRTVNYLVN